MKVLFIHSTALEPTNGENIRGNYLLSKLSNMHDIDLVTPECSKKYPHVKKFQIGRVERFGKNKEIKYALFGIKSLFLKGLRKKYDIVYCFGIAGIMLAKRYAGKSRLICDFYEVDFPELRKTKNPIVRLMLNIAKLYQRKILKKADYVILLTKKMENYARTLTNAKTLTVYDAADIKMFNENVKEKHKGFTVLFHGGIEKRDNVIIMLKAVEQVKEKIHIVIAGKGSALEELKHYAKIKNMDVQFTGWVDYEKIPGYLAKADLAVLPCTKEPLNEFVIPRKAYEYMNCGIPMIITEIEAAKELFTEKDVYYIQDPSAENVKDKLEECLKNRNSQLEKSRRLTEKSKKINLQKECRKILSLFS